MNPVEIIALIFAILILVKTATFFLIKPETIKISEKIYKKTGTFFWSVIFLVILFIVGYFLLTELTIVQILAASVFGIALYKLLLAQYPKPLFKFFTEILKNKQKLWLPWLIYIILALWVLYALFI